MSNSSLTFENHCDRTLKWKFMDATGLNNNKDRRKFWTTMVQEFQPSVVEQALSTLPPDTAYVLRLHYREGHPLKNVSSIIGKSLPVVRNHHNRGIFKLRCYFLSERYQQTITGIKDQEEGIAIIEGKNQ